jgi:hypothetical protein
MKRTSDGLQAVCQPAIAQGTRVANVFQRGAITWRGGDTALSRNWEGRYFA